MPAQDQTCVTLRARKRPAVLAVYPGILALRDADGGALRFEVSWGTAAVADGEARVVVSDVRPLGRERASRRGKIAAAA